MQRRAFFLLLFILFAGKIVAQDQTVDVELNYESPKKYVVENISIEGVKYLDPDLYIGVTGIAKGDTVTLPGDVFARAVKKLWEQDLFGDVKIRVAKVEGDKIWLKVDLLEKPRLYNWDFKGAKKSEVTDLNDKLKLKRGTTITEFMLSTTKDLIKKYYINKGYLNVDVNITQKPDTVVQNTEHLLIAINKNKKVKIKDIVFDGNNNYTDERLRRVFKKTHRRDWNIFNVSKFIKSDYENDKKELVSFYEQKGYRDAKIVNDSVYKVSDDRIGITIRLEEGHRYYFRSINWIGNTKNTAEELNTLLKIKKGDYYDKVALDKRLNTDEESVANIYQNQGYLFFNATPIEVKVENDSVDIEIRVNEGKPATISYVKIAGNDRTNEHVIRRELQTKPGDLYRRDNIVNTIRYLGQLGHFDAEKLGEGIQMDPNQQESTVGITYTVSEKSNDQLELSGGWGGNMFVGSIGLRFNNFSARRIFDKGAWRPIPTGDSQSLSLRAQTNGSYYKAFSASFTEPWLGGKKPQSFSVSLYYQVMNNSSYYYQAGDEYFKVIGGSIGLGRRLNWPDNWFTLSTAISAEVYNLKDWNGFIISNGTSTNLNFSTALSRNSTNNPIYPRGGSEVSLSLKATFPYSLVNGKDYSLYNEETKTGMTDKERYRWVEYYKVGFKGTFYQSIFKDLVLAVKGQFGYLGMYNSKVGYSPFENYVVGGDGLSGYAMYGTETIGLRGYENEKVTPVYVYRKSVQSTTILNKANVYDKFSAELRYPITLTPQSSIYVLGFFEAGNAWQDIKSFNPFQVVRSAGVGARIFLPMIGMLGIDWAYGFDDIPHAPGSGGSNFHFVIGMPTN
ncbi:BamA/OMP85 family outer membrane protein [Acetobacteroides hydrogenigenes]|uniref:Outer membrane protein insertion porin family n=1 Tax=Acetobacteroides hydrogenigenes TaxID=979970 RepID=A0A4V2RQV1_9BACT|nr:POTRA domain-containing protein [Acetobacteroides hydrogenigenes]TCN72941.1 outer membrane protein insertion porin family [Acetobacteroides hydrogenigenes]